MLGKFVKPTVEPHPSGVQDKQKQWFENWSNAEKLVSGDDR